jgi:hypothetical protein
LGYPPILFYKSVKIKGLHRKGMQECDSKGVMGNFEVSVMLRRGLEGGGGGPSIHAERCIAHKWLLVKYLCEVDLSLGRC